jgi:hypothetical protein
MNNSAVILRSLITYAICVPLALFVGYLLANQWDYSTFAVVGVLAGLMVMPLLIRWHYHLLLLSWNATLILFFLKGAPKVWLVMVVVSVGIAVVSRAINAQQRFLSVPQITWPLIYLAVVVLFTAKLTGGFGLKMLGSEVYGGKKYIFTFVSILSYFALTSRRIPPERAGVALALFFLGGITAFVGDLYYLVPSTPNFVFWLFPPNITSEVGAGAMRLLGAVGVAQAVIFYLLARYGIRELFLTGKRWRLMLFFGSLTLGLLGGHRAMVITIGGIFMIQFFLEGLHRSKLLPVFLFIGLSGLVLLIPLAPRLPLTFQRALSFLPVQVDPRARQDAKDSMEWRYAMWNALLPQVPPHLLLGKGYSFSQEDYESMGRDSAFTSIDASQQALALSSDYHNGWLSVLITFGIWGMIGVLWLFIAGFFVVYRNYRYGDPELRVANCFLLAYFIVQVLFFLSIGGSGLHGDLFIFCGDLGLSVALNGGRCRPVPVPARAPQPATQPRAFPRPRPVFQR